jgi:hypothetical protein
MMAGVRNNCSEMGNSGDYFIQERNESLLILSLVNGSGYSYTRGFRAL